MNTMSHESFKEDQMDIFIKEAQSRRIQFYKTAIFDLNDRKIHHSPTKKPAKETHSLGNSVVSIMAGNLAQSQYNNTHQSTPLRKAEIDWEKQDISVHRLSRGHYKSCIDLRENQSDLSFLRPPIKLSVKSMDQKKKKYENKTFSEIKDTTRSPKLNEYTSDRVINNDQQDVLSNKFQKVAPSKLDLVYEEDFSQNSTGKIQIQPTPDTVNFASQRVVIDGQIAENKNIQKVNDENNVKEQKQVSYFKEDANFDKKLPSLMNDKKYKEIDLKVAPGKKNWKKLKDKLSKIKLVKNDESKQLNTQSQKTVMTLNQSSLQITAFNKKNKQSIFKNTNIGDINHKIEVSDIENGAQNSSKSRDSNTSKKNNKHKKSNSSRLMSEHQKNGEIMVISDSVKKFMQQRSVGKGCKRSSISNKRDSIARRNSILLKESEGYDMTSSLRKGYHYMKGYMKEYHEEKVIEKEACSKREYKKQLKLKKDQETMKKINLLKNKFTFLNKLSPAFNDNDLRAEMKQKLKCKLAQEFSEEQIFNSEEAKRLEYINKLARRKGIIEGLNLPSYQDNLQQNQVIEEAKHETSYKAIEPKFKKTDNHLSGIKAIPNSKPIFHENVKIMEKLNKKITTDFSEFDISIAGNNSEFYSPRRNQKFFFAQSPSTMNFHLGNNQTTMNKTVRYSFDNRDQSQNSNNPGLRTHSLQHNVKSNHDSAIEEKSVNDDKIQQNMSKTTRSGVMGKGLQFMLKKIENFHDRKQLMINFKGGIHQALKVREKSHPKLCTSNSHNSGFYLEENEIKGGSVMKDKKLYRANWGKYQTNEAGSKSKHIDIGTSYETSVDKNKYTDRKKNYWMNAKLIGNKAFLSGRNNVSQNRKQS